MTTAERIPGREERHIQALPSADPASEGMIVPPDWWILTDKDLPCGNDERMPNQIHGLQITLLTTPLELYYKDRKDAYVAGEMYVYFSPYQILTDDFKGPDVFVALNVSKRVRESWVTWQEGKPPDVVIEILSKSTGMKDRKPKLKVYQDKLKAPEYVWYNPRNGHLVAFELVEGEYRRIEPDRKKRLRSRQLDLLLVRWRGVYRGVEGRWVRYATLDGVLLPTPDEVADEERRRSDEERRRAQGERGRADRLAARLREMGIDPEE